MKFDFKLSSDKQRLPPMGLIVLQVDETIETEFRQAFNNSQDQLFVTSMQSKELVLFLIQQLRQFPKK